MDWIEFFFFWSLVGLNLNTPDHIKMKKRLLKYHIQKNKKEKRVKVSHPKKKKTALRYHIQKPKIGVGVVVTSNKIFQRMLFKPKAHLGNDLSTSCLLFFSWLLMGTLIRLAALLVLVLMEGSCCEGCWKHERDRLLDLKARWSNPDPVYLTIPEPLINWVDGTDCCQWEGVQCNSTTRRVVKLILDCTYGSNRYLNLSDFLVFEDMKTLTLSGIVGCVGNGGIYIYLSLILFPPCPADSLY